MTMPEVVAFLLLSCLGLVNANCPRIVCYHTNWSQYRPNEGKFTPGNIDPTLCTHINYAFANLTNSQLVAYEWNDESTEWSVGLYEQFINLKSSNPNVKLLLAVGGWNMGSEPFMEMVATAANRKLFIDSSMALIKKYGFDGLDLDWEYPAGRNSPPEDKGRFTTLVQELRAAFDANGGLLLTAAVAAGKENIDAGYDIPEISKHLDFINLMTYDFHGKWENHTGIHSPLYGRASEQGNDAYLNMAWAANYWAASGAPKSKLNVGMGLYGRSFTLTSPSDSGLYAPASGAGSAGTYTREAGFISYYEICMLKAGGGTEYFEPEQHNPYLVKGDQWIGYDNPSSLREKVSFVKNNGFGGAMVWAIDLDDFTGTFCGLGTWPLLTAINQECGNVYSATSGPDATTAAPGQTTVTQTLTSTTTQAPQPTTVSSSSPTTVPADITDFCVGEPDGVQADPTSCHFYIHCAHQITHRVECSEGTVFNAALMTCDMPASVPSCV